MSRSVTGPPEWTYSEYARLPDDGNHYEVIDGEICTTPAAGPRHQWIVGTLYIALRHYVDDNRLGKVFFDVDLLFISNQFLRPDLLYVPTERVDGITDRGVETVPGLVIEVLSPHSMGIDRVKKPRRYREFGIPEYWVVDPETRTIEVYRWASGGSESPEVAAEFLIWQPSAGTPALKLDVAALFV